MNKNIFLKLIGKDSISDSEYDFYFGLAVRMIENYLRIGDDYDDDYINVSHYYEEQVVLLASHIYKIHENTIASNQNVGIKSISSNGRSVTFMSFDELNNIGIPQYIKDMLPLPQKSKVRVW